MEQEVWLPVKRFEGYYEVSNMGNIRRTKSKRLRAISHTDDMHRRTDRNSRLSVSR
ncbi:MAG: hypothetical protein J5510_00695 [Prevotella sp.]|nr:hypothetical protein [Prevotella sp.]